MLLISENSGIKFIKFSLIFLTIILGITGLSLIIEGSTINEIFIEFSSLLTGVYFSPATLLISGGFMILTISCFGFMGAIKESVCIIMTFGILLGLTSVVQLCAGLSSNIFMIDIAKYIELNINSSMAHYYDTPKAQIVMDRVQKELHCCGLNGPLDWFGPQLQNTTVPTSCFYNSSNKIYTLGCRGVLETIIKNSSLVLTESAFLLSLIQIFGMVFALYLGKLLRNQKMAREYRRWVIRNQLLANIGVDQYINPYCLNQKTEKENLS